MGRRHDPRKRNLTNEGDHQATITQDLSFSLLKATKMKEMSSMGASQSRETFQDSMKFDTNYTHTIAYTYVHMYT